MYPNVLVHIHFSVLLDDDVTDIDQWNQVTKVLGTPSSDFFKQLNTSVGGSHDLANDVM